MTKIAYLGPPGTYTEEAAERHKPGAERIPFPSVAQAIAAVESGKANQVVCAIENSIEGTVTDTVDLLIHETRLFIRRELVIPISHSLLAKPGVSLGEIEVVYSHVNALGQCRKFLAAKVPKAEALAALSTVKAVEEAKASVRPAAAIAPERAAKLYRVKVLAKGIQDSQVNATRFVVLAKRDHPPTGDDKTSIAFSFAEDKPGQLYRVMGEFANRNLNLSKVESRPSKESLGKYVFLLDVGGHREDAKVGAAFERVKSLTSMWKVFGSYPRFKG